MQKQLEQLEVDHTCNCALTSTTIPLTDLLYSLCQAVHLIDNMHTFEVAPSSNFPFPLPQTTLHVHNTHN